MKKMKFLVCLLAVLSMGAMASAQTSKQSASVVITVTAPTPAVQLTAQSSNVQAGQTLSLTANVTQGGAPAPGSIDLCAQAPGSNSLVFVQSFQLTSGSVTCTYPIPASAATGSYTITAQYPGVGSCQVPNQN